MAHRLTTEFHFETGMPGPNTVTFAAEGGLGTVVIRGSMSTGMGRWILSAQATRHRRKINVQVLARRESMVREEILEEHTYLATVRGIPAGKYWVRVNHLCHAPDLDLPPDGISPIEASVMVGEPGCVT